jgi:glycosyltransferase involved in cell wall biosynthesis
VTDRRGGRIDTSMAPNGTGMSDKSRLAVGIPVYNGEKFLPELLACLERQTLTDFDVILADNASSDRTGEICMAFAQRNPRTTYVRNPSNIGSAANFNRVFELSSSTYFCWLASDDLILPAFLERCVAVLDADPSVVLAFTARDVIDDEGKLIPAAADGNGFIYAKNNFRVIPQRVHVAEGSDPVERYKEILEPGYSGNHLYGVMRSSVLGRTVLHDKFPGADLALLMELALRGRFKTVDEPLFRRRYHVECSTFFAPQELERYVGLDGASSAYRFVRARAYARAILRTEALTLSERTRGLSVLAVNTAYGVAEMGVHKLRSAVIPGRTGLATR